MWKHKHDGDYGWGGTVTPAKDGYTFEPKNCIYSNVTINQSGHDYAATLLTYMNEDKPDEFALT